MSAPATTSPGQGRAVAVRAGVRIETVTVVWMSLEAVLSIGAGVIAHSVLLIAFGLDSVIELVTGGVLLWRLSVEARGGSVAGVERAEHRAAWVTGISLCLLCLYILASVAASLLSHTEPERSLVGLVVAVSAVLGMPVLARRKRQIATWIGSAALRGDAACSITCAYMAATLLVGLGLNAVFGWWWADSLAALALLYWLQGEAREALAGARAGRGACACGDDGCRD